MFSSRGPRSPPRVSAVAAAATAATGASTSAISSPPRAPVSPASTMPILLFLIDTSASMNQRSHLGTTYLDTAKGAVETFMKVPTDRAPGATRSRWPAGGRAGGSGFTAGSAGAGTPPPPRGRASGRAGGRWERALLGLAHVWLLWVRGAAEGRPCVCGTVGAAGDPYATGNLASVLPSLPPVPTLARSSVPGTLPAEETGICWSLSKSRPMLSR